MKRNLKRSNEKKPQKRGGNAGTYFWKRGEIRIGGGSGRGGVVTVLSSTE